MEARPQVASRGGFTLIGPLVVGEAARRSRCRNKLEPIALGAIDHESSHGVLPLRSGPTVAAPTSTVRVAAQADAIGAPSWWNPDPLPTGMDGNVRLADITDGRAATMMVDERGHGHDPASVAAAPASGAECAVAGPVLGRGEIDSPAPGSRIEVSPALATRSGGEVVSADSY